ncbi:MAG: hypothetical protein ABIJ59_02685 [Pseudomonadota bacterium]
MSIWLKIDVCGDLQPVVAKARGRVAQLYDDNGEDLYITAKRDGLHGLGSLHYEGLAFDFRYPKKEISDFISKIRSAAGPGFDVIAEGNHIHVEWDPKQVS